MSMENDNKPNEEIMKRISIFAGSSIASVALEAEIDDCHHRLKSGDILMSTAASNAEGHGNRSSHEIAVHPFVEAYDGELNRLANVLSNHKVRAHNKVTFVARFLVVNKVWRFTFYVSFICLLLSCSIYKIIQLAIESLAEALLKNIDGLSRRKDKLSNVAVTKELSETRKQATVLENKTLRINAEAMKNEKELHRIAFLADTRLGTACVEHSYRQFTLEPWVDRFSTGHIVKILSDIFSFIR